MKLQVGDYVKLKSTYSLEGLANHLQYQVKECFSGFYYGAHNAVQLWQFAWDPPTRSFVREPVTINGYERFFNEDIFEKGKREGNMIVFAEADKERDIFNKFQFTVEVPVPRKETVTGYLDWVVLDTYNETVIAAFTNESQAKRFIEMCACDHYILRKIVF